MPGATAPIWYIIDYLKMEFGRVWPISNCHILAQKMELALFRDTGRTVREDNQIGAVAPGTSLSYLRLNLQDWQV